MANFLEATQRYVQVGVEISLDCKGIGHLAGVWKNLGANDVKLIDEHVTGRLHGVAPSLPQCVLEK